jgi:hypothetical protein
LIPRFNFSARANAGAALALTAPPVWAAAQPATRPANKRNAAPNFTRPIFVRLIASNPFRIDTLMATDLLNN